jgi:hypothetical protein
MAQQNDQESAEMVKIEQSQPNILSYLANSGGKHLNVLFGGLATAGVLVVAIAIIFDYTGLIDFRLTKDGLHLQIDGKGSSGKTK